jgi:hypothetical protein
MGTADTSNSTSRRGLANTFQVDSTKGVTPKPDATEDAALQIGDQSVADINTQNTQAEAEVSAAGGPADLD